MYPRAMKTRGRPTVWDRLDNVNGVFSRFPGVRNVLGDFGQEIERIEHLEVAGGAGQQFLVARFGKATDGPAWRDAPSCHSLPQPNNGFCNTEGASC